MLQAGTITVDGITCTLADAITTANSGIDSGGCIGGSDASDIISIQTNITLTAAPPSIASPIIIEGNDHTIFNDNSSYSYDAILTVAAEGELTLNNVIISGTAEAIENLGGTVSINDSTISNRAYSYSTTVFNNGGDMVLNNVSVQGNTSGYGGGTGVHNYGYGALTIHGSTITGNRIGILNTSGTVAIENSTIDQLSLWGIMNYGESITVKETTISNSRHGIESARGTTIIDNSLIHDNDKGVYNRTGTVLLNASIITGNNTGVHNRNGELTINSSTIHSNQNFYASYYSPGGGIVSSSASNSQITINNSTISNNFGDEAGGIYNQTTGGVTAITLNNTTVSGNTGRRTGGIRSVSSRGLAVLNINRSIVSGNTTAGSSAEIARYGTVLNMNNHNILGDNRYDNNAAFDGFAPCQFGVGNCTDMTATNDGSHPTVLNAILDPVLTQVGDLLPIHALVRGSIAIDTAPSMACLQEPIHGLDQQGQARNFNGDALPSDFECDSGAVEYTNPLIFLPLVKH